MPINSNPWHGVLAAVPGPGAKATRLLLLAELVSAAGFERDRLYIEWQLHYDPEQWILQHSDQEVVQPGLIQVGVMYRENDLQASKCSATAVASPWARGQRLSSTRERWPSAAAASCL
jgi:hypothetical protein